MKGTWIKKDLALAIILLFVIPSVVSTFNIENKSYPFNNGNWLYVGGSGGGNYSKIQDAINDSVDGDFIYVYQGTYYENIVIDKSISLIGENKNTTTIDANFKGNGITIFANQVNINEFTIKNGYTNITISKGISISSHNNNITNNIISNNFYGIEISNSINNTFYDNIISNNSVNGIYIKDESKFNNIINNKISFNKFPGIAIYNSTNNMIIDNNFSSNTLHGIFLSGSHNNIIKGNNISYDGIALYSCINNTIIYNKIISSNKPGLYIKGGSDNIICNNVISKNYDGINIQESDNNIFTSNSISNNEHAFVLSDCHGNIIQKNNLLDNKKDVEDLEYYHIFNKSEKKNIWKENYWNKPRFLPKPVFGIGVIIIPDITTIPFILIAFDWHPAKEPYDITI